MACLSRCARLLWKEWDNLWKHLLCMPVRHSEGGKGYVSMCIGEDKLESYWNGLVTFKVMKDGKVTKYNNIITLVHALLRRVRTKAEIRCALWAGHANFYHRTNRGKFISMQIKKITPFVLRLHILHPASKTQRTSASVWPRL